MPRPRNPFPVLVGLATACFLFATSAEAQIDLGAIVATSPNTKFLPYRAKDSDRVPVFVRAPESADDEALADGLIRLNSGLYGTCKAASDLSLAITSHPDWKWIWAPPRRLLLDRVIPSIHADVARTKFGRRGAGVIVGIVTIPV